uniref:Uncharacterized protein n=1 Tax=Oryza punctata TaxID=4537 RepID=A0A0E0JSD6_ORYPU
MSPEPCNSISYCSHFPAAQPSADSDTAARFNDYLYTNQLPLLHYDVNEAAFDDNEVLQGHQDGLLQLAVSTAVPPWPPAQAAVDVVGSAVGGDWRHRRRQRQLPCEGGRASGGGCEAFFLAASIKSKFQITERHNEDHLNANRIEETNKKLGKTDKKKTDPDLSSPSTTGRHPTSSKIRRPELVDVGLGAPAGEQQPRNEGLGGRRCLRTPLLP